MCFHSLPTNTRSLSLRSLNIEFMMYQKLVKSGSRSRSRTLTEGQRREMGQYLDPKSGGFPGFRIGTMMADFQMGECWRTGRSG